MRTIREKTGTGDSSRKALSERLQFLTREELGELLQVSKRTIDALVTHGEIPCVRLRGAIVRFYLPDVIGHLTAAGKPEIGKVRNGTGFNRKARKGRKEDE